MIKLKIQGFQETKEQLVKELSKFSGIGTATVGVHKQNSVRPDGLSNAQVAMENHYGTDAIPARPFLDVGVEAVIPQMNSTFEREMKKSGNAEQALVNMAGVALDGVVDRIDNTYTPPNSPETIKRKGSSHPLIDTGEMRRSISWEIQK